MRYVGYLAPRHLHTGLKCLVPLALLNVKVIRARQPTTVNRQPSKYYRALPRHKHHRFSAETLDFAGDVNRLARQFDFGVVRKI